MFLERNFIDNFFDDSFAIRRMNNHGNITHDDDGAVIKLKVPGFNKKSIDVSVDSDTLTIEGKTDDDSFTKKYSVDNKLTLIQLMLKSLMGC